MQIAWLPLKSPCVREHISIVVQLAFLVLLLLQFLRKLVSLLCRNRTEVRDQGVEKYMAGVKFNISYRITIVCSTLLFGNHLIMLLTMLNGGEILCDSKVLAFSSEVMQVVLWASTLLTIYKIPNNKYAKFPWILRAWWFCSFSLYIICTALDAYSRVTNHSQFKVGDYADFVCLLPSTLLFGISIRGKTGLVYALTNDTTEPLINGKTDTPLEYKRESLYGKANLFQLVTFSWLNPLFAVGIKKPLDQNEIPDVDVKDSAEFLSHDFDERLKQVKQKDGSVNPSMYKAIFLFIRKKAAINALLAVISAVSSYVGPYLIDDFVNFLNEKNKRSLKTGAVDAHTGTQLFEECLMGMLKDKTVLYVTHQVEFLPAADLILASTDQSVLDLELAGRLGTCAITIIQIIGTIAVMSQAAWQVFVIFIPVTAICIWYQALDKCQLGDLVRAKEKKLDSPVVENGENWSVGQRQLFCLGRTLLKKSSILVLDEATASVDSATDGVIQKIISQEFKDRTVVTIAHRIHTVIDSDLVLVLSDGRIAEYDSPKRLLEREDSFFSKLIKEYSMRSQNFNTTQQ
ncbi:hypothetical protein Q3G72_007184 [Acer saccharum]|nr:hypothetical protein Q3G72_007184 [Acer saccharum]